MFNFLKTFKSVVNVGETKMVILVRTDLKMGQGKIASQCAHAAVTLYDSAARLSNSELKSWIVNGQPKVVLRVSENCEAIMKSLYREAKDSNLNACLIYDAGKTQLQTGTLTVLGIGPNKKDDVDKLTKTFKLL